MPRVDELMAIEKKLWTHGSDFYRRNVDGQCLVAFPNMSGVFSNDEFAETVRGARWLDPELSVKGLVEPTPGFAILTYEARARHADGEAYSAIVSSGYVRRGDAWRLAFHQQTPLRSPS